MGRQQKRKHRCLRSALRRPDSLRINVECGSQRGMSHQFLHDLEFDSETSEQSRERVTECVPTYPFLDAQPSGSRLDVMTKNHCSPIGLSSIVQSTGEYPIVAGFESALRSPRDQCSRELSQRATIRDTPPSARSGSDWRFLNMTALRSHIASWVFFGLDRRWSSPIDPTGAAGAPDRCEATTLTHVSKFGHSCISLALSPPLFLECRLTI